MPTLLGNPLGVGRFRSGIAPETAVRPSPPHRPRRRSSHRNTTRPAWTRGGGIPAGTRRPLHAVEGAVSFSGAWTGPRAAPGDPRRRGTAGRPRAGRRGGARPCRPPPAPAGAPPSRARRESPAAPRRAPRDAPRRAPGGATACRRAPCRHAPRGCGPRVRAPGRLPRSGPAR